MSKLHCTIVTPESTILDAMADFIAAPLFDGEIGILPGRAPLIGRLGYGEMRLRSGDKIERFYIDGGFVQVADNEVSILTGQAAPAKTLDVGALELSLARAKDEKATTEESLLARTRAITRGHAQIRVARREREGAR